MPPMNDDDSAAGFWVSIKAKIVSDEHIMGQGGRLLRSIPPDLQTFSRYLPKWCKL